MNLLRFLIIALMVTAPGIEAASPESAIKSVLDRQADDWNRGDLVSFVSFYAAKCTLVRSSASDVPREEILSRYKKAYPSREAMGKLSFSNIDVHLVDGQVATLTGNFHLDRTASAGGPSDGIFTLVFRLAERRWLIILDHTSSTPKS